MERSLLKCRACGYIVKQEDIKEVCPACGLPKTVFQPYKDNVSPQRSLVLNLHLHPIAVHFPQAFVIVLLPLIVFGMILGQTQGRDILSTAKVLSLLLPLFSLPAVLTGLIDAKMRFRKLNTRALRIKMLAGGIFFMLSCLISAIVFLYGLNMNSAMAISALLIICMACQAVLGRIGAKLLGAVLGG